MVEAMLRPARRDDVPALVKMRDELNALELQGSPHAPIRKLSVTEFDERWGVTIGTEDHCWLIVESSGGPVGFGMIYLMPQPTPPAAFIQWAYLDQRQRRRGLGEQLLGHLTEWARGKGANRIELQFIEGNEAAQRFWTKMGFQPYARKCVQYL
jgi:GNAT superfamily N-acetyltransferase